MKRAVLIGLSLFGATVLSGCPIYPEERLFCETTLDCPKGYACDSDTGYCVVTGGSGGSSGKTCDEPKDCGFNQTCSSKGLCKTGDCSFHGCVTGYSCVVESGAWACVAGGDAGDGGDAGGTGGTGGTGGGGTGGGSGATGGTGGAAGNDGGDGSAGDDGGDAASTDGASGGDAATD
ncbi:MAG: hypothetical protein IT377_23755 [Polyangiaceae bacterium]|nr:hypothetical protein [Polyangiaceae bacterium]